ncbi:MAG TPA: ribonuclease III domain-containing protein [Anaerovoracaceae bacterium]|nr:ribonuclease III domain-containing protein [Anaerovoracaceae bacterium]
MKKLNSKEINSTALAYIGDAVYEIYVRRHVMETGQTNADRLHQMAIQYVCADGQAKAVKKLMQEFLTEEEVRAVKRARNHKTTSKPKNADPVIYKLATAFEALVGQLYIDENTARLEEVIFEAFNIIEAGEKNE